MEFMAPNFMEDPDGYHRFYNYLSPLRDGLVATHGRGWGIGATIAILLVTPQGNSLLC